MKKDLFNKLIIIFIFLNPILDVLVGFQMKYNLGSVTIGTIIRGLFFIMILVYMFINKIKRKSILLFVVFSITSILYNYLILKNGLVFEASNIMLIFYLPFLIYFFSNVENKKIDDKLIFILYLIYINLLIIPSILGVGFNTYDAIYKKSGYLGLFTSGNEISAILIGLLPICTNYLLSMKNTLLKLLIGIEILVGIFMVGTKTLIIGLLITIIYFVVRYIKNNYKSISSKVKGLSLLCAIILIVLSIVVVPKLPIFKNMGITLKYYEVHNIKDLFKYKNIDNIVYSGRLSYLKKVNKYYFKRKPLIIAMGLGRQGLIAIKDVEIDIFDILYSIGLIGLIVYLILMIDCFRKNKFKDHYLLSMILFILMSLTSGHVLIRPMVSIYMAIIFILNKNNLKEDQ